MTICCVFDTPVFVEGVFQLCRNTITIKNNHLPYYFLYKNGHLFRQGLFPTKFIRTKFLRQSLFRYCSFIPAKFLCSPEPRNSGFRKNDVCRSLRIAAFSVLMVGLKKTQTCQSVMICNQ